MRAGRDADGLQASPGNVNLVDQKPGLPCAIVMTTEVHKSATEFEWQPDGGLRTRQLRSAVVRHPLTGQRCWFNQIAFLNERTLDPEIREYLVDVYGEDGLPFNTCFGNGDPIGDDVVGELDLAPVEHPLEGVDQRVDGELGERGEPLADCSPTVEVSAR